MTKTNWDIYLRNVSKRFGSEWIFKEIDTTLKTNQPCAIIGGNGSGKSTLLQLIAGIIPATEGEVRYYHYPQKMLTALENWYKYLAIATPYLELIEEMTLTEVLHFHTQFKPLKKEISINDFLELIWLKDAQNKAIKHFSSGMKQRLKLGLAFYTNTPIILLDEPTTNLDVRGIDWYENTIQDVIKDRLCVICSNQKKEYHFCTQIIDVEQYKK